tara:strand:+ start:1859 stop:2587 length:729 start_codon:yes stop_codon:yes gene_type:complete
MWFELVAARHVAVDVGSCRGWRWTMPSEVVNEQNVAGDPVDPMIREDLLRKPGLSRVGCPSDKEVRVSHAQVGYYAGPSETLGYGATIGVTRGDKFAPFGCGYYLDSYERAQQVMARSTGGPICMVRYAVAPGRTTMLLGRETDPVDRAPMTSHLGAVKPLVKAAAKVRDADGRWADTCGGIGRGRLAVDVGGARHVMAPRFCVEGTANYIPLEYCGSQHRGRRDSPKTSSLSYTRKHEHSE